jgi:TonB-linked SusC/RagA family outer membrane protein
MQLKNLLKVSCFAILCFFVMPAMAQNKVVTGKVTDSHDGSPMPGVSIVAKGSTIGTNTDANGAFRLSMPASANTLVVSFIGFTKQEVDITGKSIVNVALVGSATTLSEVQIVSVGYGSQRKKDITGAVSNVSSKDFNQGAIINPLDQVQGKVAGLVITQGGGDPNQNATIRLRGQSSITGSQTPLFVVDGVALDDPNQFQNIPPGDIESYDVLKDASATAIYGSRGANGVIIVTTKKGRAGRTQVDYNAYMSVGTTARKYELLSPSEYRAAIADLPNKATYDKGGNTDWQDAIAQKAFTTSNNVAISGGAGDFNYRASINYQNQPGIILNSGKKQLGVRFNAEQKALDGKLALKLGVSNVNTTRKLTAIPPSFDASNPNGTDLRNPTDYSVFNYVFNSPPTYPIKNADGTYYIYNDYNEANPVMHLLQTTNGTNEYLTIINGSADYSLLPSLKIGVTGSTSRNNVQTHYFQPTFPGENNINNARDGNYNTNSYKGDIHINYEKTFGKHNLSVVGVYEYNDFINSNLSGGSQDFLVPENLDNSLGGGNSAFNKIFSYKEEYKLISYVGRVNYNYDDRFYATATLRSDGSTKFGANSRRGNFPSINFAYRLKKDLLNGVDWINDLKIRGGYGVVGNSDAISPYSDLVLYGPNKKYYDPAGGTFLYPNGYAPIQNANPDLRWEERHGRNIGMDFSLFNDRLSGDINYFSDFTKNLLYNYTVGDGFLYPIILANVGRLTNKGLEIALTGKPIKTESFNWTVSGQIAFIKTRITDLSGSYAGFPINTDQIPLGYATGRGLSSSPITYLKTGYAPYAFYLPHFTGVDAAGNQLLDGKTVAQYTSEGTSPQSYFIDPSPKFNYGISNTFNYKNWNFSFFLRGVYGQKLFNNNLLNFETVTRIPTNNTTKDALTNGIKDGPYVSDRWLQGASYLRLDNASLGYTFKNVKGFQAIRLYVAANNLFIITKYKGSDPEIPNSDDNSGLSNGYQTTTYQSQPYINNGYYPKVRAFTFGTNISFK